MLSILRKAAASMAKTGGSSSTDRCGDFDDDLSAWEFVQAAFSDDEDVYSFDGDADIDVFGEEPEPAVEPQAVGEEIRRAARDFVNPKVIYSITCLSVSPRTTSPFEMMRGGDGDGDGDDFEDEHDVDDYDFDDELVPWRLKNMLGKERIRKIGKKGAPKLSKSKKLLYCHNKPGCSYGKHGFGVRVI